MREQRENTTVGKKVCEETRGINQVSDNSFLLLSKGA